MIKPAGLTVNAVSAETRDVPDLAPVVPSVVQSERWAWGEKFLVLFLTVLALAVRIYALHEFPPGLYVDEAANGLDVIEILNGHHPIFFERNNGREPLFLYAQALVAYWAGLTPFALRLTAAFFGAATVPVFYWMVRTLFAHMALPASWAAAWASLFVAFSYWHISLSRIGFRAITLPFVVCIAFGFFWRAVRHLEHTKRLPWIDLILSGVFTGLTLYTYTASRTVPFVLAITLAAGVLFGRKQRISWQRGAAALGIIGLTALIVFSPLGLYFANNRDTFFDRTNDISIFNADVAQEGPLRALGRNVVRTALMFVSWPDSNLRHNPAQRPVFDLLLVGWLGVGLVVSLVRWRKIPYLFCVLWLGLLAVPPLLSYQAMPHSLRSIGMLPAAYLLAVIGMLWVGRLLPGRLASLAMWLPLPFFLFSATTDVRDYFAAWKDMGRFRGAFFVDYAQAGALIARHSSPDSVWVLPRSPNFQQEDVSPALFTMDFLVRDRAGFGSVTFGEDQAPVQLAALSQGRRFVHVLQLQDAEFLAKVSLVYDDVKGLLDFLLRKHGRPAPQEHSVDIGIPYITYEAPPDGQFLITHQPVSLTVTFGNSVQLVQVDYGRTRLDLDEPVTVFAEKSAPSGHDLWAVLRWQPVTPIDFDLKVSLLLKDDFGHVAGQTDLLLVGDHYPVLRTWPSGERASTYHILSTLPGVPPGRYHLYAKVYEEQSGRIYPAYDQSGQSLGTEVRLGDFEITPAQRFLPLAAEHPLTDVPQLAPGLALTGLDLSRSTVAPGDRLSLTLYWQAMSLLAVDYEIAIRLRDATGASLVEHSQRPGNNSYPTTSWRLNETLRDWHDLTLPPTLQAGRYELVVDVHTDKETVGEMVLSQIDVSGRPRIFTPPVIALPVSANFGQLVQLLGVDGPASVPVTPGGVLTTTLVWQVQNAGATPLVRFVHMLGPEGLPVAQQDTTPCAETCPSTSWLAGEILIDPVTLTLPADLPTGEYRLVTGWYDAGTIQRLTASDAAGAPLADQIMVLPIEIVIAR